MTGPQTFLAALCVVLAILLCIATVLVIIGFVPTKGLGS